MRLRVVEFASFKVRMSGVGSVESAEEVEESSSSSSSSPSPSTPWRSTVCARGVARGDEW